MVDPLKSMGVNMRRRRHPLALGMAVLCAGLAGCGSSSPPVANTTGSPAPATAGSRDVTFVADATTAYGTLDVPAHRDGQHLAAAVLLAGSGGTDRDGNQEPSLTPNTLKQIAEALDRMGIISLRFDKYFAGRTGAGKFASDPSAIDLNAFIRQAGGAYKLLYDQPETDRRRMLVIGHSEGGLYAMLLAETATPQPAGLAMVEPLDERSLDLLAVQINEGLDAQVSSGSITAEAARSNAQGVRSAIAAFRAGQPVDTTNLLPSVVTALKPFLLSPTNATFERTEDAIDPATYAAKLPAGLRVLMTDGTADRNVPPPTIQPLADGLARAGTIGPGLQRLDNLDHYLHPAGTPESGSQLDPAFLKALSAWAQPFASG
jgi:pimeloyl-ACP methyl ester carboxylesterase